MQLPELTSETKTRIEGILGRASEDIAFRNTLLSDPAEALAEYNLADNERDVFVNMRRVALEEWGIDVRRFRAFLRDNGAKITPS